LTSQCCIYVGFIKETRRPIIEIHENLYLGEETTTTTTTTTRQEEISISTTESSSLIRSFRYFN
jgi:hypothetical protein